MLPTGLAVAIPAGYEGQVRMRSGLAIRHGLCLLNGPGTIDSDYRGEIHVILANLGAEPVTIARGERIAQLVIAPVTRAPLGAGGRASRDAARRGRIRLDGEKLRRQVSGAVRQGSRLTSLNLLHSRPASLGHGLTERRQI